MTGALELLIHNAKSLRAEVSAGACEQSGYIEELKNGIFHGPVKAFDAALQVYEVEQFKRAMSVDEQWLESIGFLFDRDADLHQGHISFGECSLYATRRVSDWMTDGFEWTLDLKWVIKTPKNRGQVRDLLAALGVTTRS